MTRHISIGKTLATLFLLVALPLSVVGAHAYSVGKPLPTAEAFRTKLVKTGDEVEIKIEIEPGYYLYKTKFKVDAGPDHPDASLEMPQGFMKQDPWLGDIEVFRGDIVLKVLGVEGDKFNLTLGFQGCQNKGICYLPATEFFKVRGDGEYEGELQ